MLISRGSCEAFNIDKEAVPQVNPDYYEYRYKISTIMLMWIDDNIRTYLSKMYREYESNSQLMSLFEEELFDFASNIVLSNNFSNGRCTPSDSRLYNPNITDIKWEAR